LASLRPEIEKLQVSYSKVAPVLKAREDEVAELKEVLTKLNKEQASLRDEVKAIKEEIQNVNDKISNDKILALNALILAYSQSVLYLDGVKLSDSQATFHGLLLAACFFFISHSKPLKFLSKKRPLPNIFNVYTLLTVFMQFFLHFVVMISVVQASIEFAPEDRPAKVDLEKKFSPNLLNSVVYIVSLSLQVTTFLVNYRGHPFMESVTENKPFFYSILMATGAVVCLISRVIPDFNEQFEIVPIPAELQKSMFALLAMDVVGSFVLDRICMWFFGEGQLRLN